MSDVPESSPEHLPEEAAGSSPEHLPEEAAESSPGHLPEEAAGSSPPPAPRRSGAEDAAARARAVVDEVGRVVLGQDRVLEQMLTVLLAGGHALLEGPPGVAKTLAIRALALALDLEFTRIQFTPDLMPADLTGVSVFEEPTGRFEFRPGPLFTEILLADEINRAPAKTQAALLESMQERQVTSDGVSRPLPDTFTVFATQNPLEYEGTFPLPEAQLDRFLLKIEVAYPDAASERAILDRYDQGFQADVEETYGIEPLVDADGLRRLREVVRGLHVEPSVRDYITGICRATREDPRLTLGASPRASVALFLASRARALLAGRDFVTPDDVKSLVLPALRHRVILTPEAEVEGHSADARLLEILETVEAPARSEA